MKVSGIAHTVLVTVAMDHTVGRARDIMQMKRIRHLLVMDEGKLVGVITDRDVRAHLSPRINTPVENLEDEKTLETKIHQVMTRDLITVSPDTPIGEAAFLLLKHKIGCLPVIDEDGSTVGVVTDADFLGYLAREEKAKEDH
jgi:acetoin utilization protein AcuB